MNCLCCGKPIPETAKDFEKINQWHSRCIKKFFNTSKLPDIDISEKILNELAVKSTNKGITVPGVQKKLSICLSDENSAPRLTLVNYPTGYILKPQTEKYPCLPEAEYLIMQMAEKAKIKTVPHALIRIKAQDNSLAYITKRIDRLNGKMLAMEDFCQLEGRLTEDKYKGSYERCAKIIFKYSSRTGLDIIELFYRLVFSYIVGNSDMHLKNFSLIETDENSKKYVLSEAYDMLPVNTVNPEDKEQTALTMNEKHNNINRNDFLKFADSCKIERKVAIKIIDKFKKLSDCFIKETEESYLTDDLKENLISLISDRISRL